MDMALRDVAGHYAEDEGLGEIDAEDGGVVMGVAVQGRRFDLEVVEAGDRHALAEVLDVPVAALAGVGVRLFVEVEVAEIEGALVRAGQLLVLDEVLVETPGLRDGGRLAQTGLDEAVGGLEILVDEETGRHQRLADRVEVAGGLLLGEVGGQPEGVDATSEQGGEGVLVFAVGKPAQDRARASALQRSLGRGGALAQGADGREAFFVGRLVGLLRRHLPQGQLVDDVAGLDDFRQRLERQRELLEGAVALLDVGRVAFQAVAAQELLDLLGGRLGGGKGRGRQGGGQGQQARSA